MDIPFVFALLARSPSGLPSTCWRTALTSELAFFLVAPREADRDLMMASIEPVWDGNETWLVFGGTLLFAAFPAAYYILLPAFYLPIMFMLFALIFRGIAFGFRLPAVSYRRIWDIAFGGGSVLAVLCQGLVLGGFIGGVPTEEGMFYGSPFSLPEYPRRSLRARIDWRLRANGRGMAHLED